MADDHRDWSHTSRCLPTDVIIATLLDAQRAVGSVGSGLSACTHFCLVLMVSATYFTECVRIGQSWFRLH